MVDALPLIMTGRVKDTNDPDKFGRVQVEVPTYTGPLVLPWLRILQGSASSKSGNFFLPEVGDEVIILRGDGPNPDGMIVLGCVYGGTDRLPQKKKKPGKAGEPPTALEPHEEDGKNNVKQFISRAGHEILLDDTDDKGQIRISTGDGKMAITLDVAGEKMTVFGPKAVVVSSAGTLDIIAKEAMTIDAAELTVTTTKGDVGITAKGDFNAEGMNVKVAGKTNGNFEGKTAVNIKGGVVQMGK